MADNPYSAPDAALTDKARAPGEPITPAMVEAASASGPWARFLAVFGFLGVMLMGCGGLGSIGMAGFALLSPEMASDPDIGPGAAVLAGMGLLYLFMGALYLLPSVQLNRLASAAARVSSGGGSDDMLAVVDNTRAFLKTVGIMILGGIALYFLLILGFMVVGIAFSELLPDQ